MEGRDAASKANHGSPAVRLLYKQCYGWLHVRDAEENAWYNGLHCNTAGRVFVTYRMGIRVRDPETILCFMNPSISDLQAGSSRKMVLNCGNSGASRFPAYKMAAWLKRIGRLFFLRRIIKRKTPARDPVIASNNFHGYPGFNSTGSVLPTTMAAAQ
ncbi:MAG TPA: hypothetical protein DIC22_00175 [Chitinophagaceae bacterium]|nr:hypothetical protein [Chitinophagaceae bacterium]